jgi:hypothetical protein
MRMIQSSKFFTASSGKPDFFDGTGCFFYELDAFTAMRFTATGAPPRSARKFYG